MLEKEDWRLTDQEEYLLKKTLYLRKWRTPSAGWDHDHCEFCGETFSEFPDTLHEGYTTADGYDWICKQCFADFKERFQWTVGPAD